MKEKLKVGIFDSGIGGFSILDAVLQLMPHLEIYYIADHAFAPYGEKSPVEVKERCEILTRALLEKNVDLIIVACNTATAIGIDHLRQAFSLPFVGVEPYLNVQNQLPMEGQRPVVLTTQLMGKSERFLSLKKRLDPHERMAYYSCLNLASLIELAYEEGVTQTILSQIKDELLPLKGRSFTHAILGCTHYPLLAKPLGEFLMLETISPCSHVARRVQSLLSVSETSEQQRQFWFMSTRNKEWFQKPVSELSLTWPVLE